MRLTLTALFCFAGSTLTQAAPFTTLNSDTVYEVASDYSWTMEVSKAYRVDEAQAVANAGQFSVPYNGSLQTVSILEAYTTTSSGTRIDVPANKIFKRVLPTGAGTLNFSDTNSSTVVFPQV